MRDPPVQEVTKHCIRNGNTVFLSGSGQVTARDYMKQHVLRVRTLPAGTERKVHADVVFSKAIDQDHC